MIKMRLLQLALGSVSLLALTTTLSAQAAAFSNQGVATGVQYLHNSGGFSNWNYTGGGAAGDFNNDGYTDIIAVGGGQSGSADRLFINDADGTGHFTNEAAAWGTNITHKGKGASVADFNDDGWLDSYITSAGPPGGSSGVAGAHVLWKNMGNETMSNVAGTAGVNFTTFFSEKLYGPLEGSKLSLDDSWGLAAEIGADFMLGEAWFLNVSARFIDINTDAKVDGADIGEVNIDPWVYGAHVGFRF